MERKARSAFSLLLLIITSSLALSEIRNARHNRRNRRLVGGKTADFINWGFLAKIKYNSEANVLWKICSASLIGSQWLLTAAHCVRNVKNNIIKPEDFAVILGDEHEYGTTNEYVVSKLALPENKSIGVNTRYTMFDKDIALIKLRDKVPSYVQRISFNRTWRKAQLRSCKVAGWGSKIKTSLADIRSGNYKLSKALQEIDVSLIPFKQHCKEVNEHGKLCIGSIGAKGNFLNGACIGDSGSPLICEDEMGKQLIGIVVGGSGRCKPLSLIVTNLNAYKNWIRQQKLLLSMF